MLSQHSIPAVRLLLLDNFDSFTFTLADYLRQLGAEVTVLRNDVPLARLQAQPWDGIVLSPGPGAPARAGILPAVIAHYHNQLPMLGVCLGHQALGEFFGATLRRAARPMHGKVATMRCQSGSGLFDDLPEYQAVTRYHSLVLAEPLPPALRPLARTHDAEAELMSLRHATLPLYGVQFHPEALLTAHGLPILANWLRCCSIAEGGDEVMG